VVGQGGQSDSWVRSSHEVQTPSEDEARVLVGPRDSDRPKWIAEAVPNQILIAFVAKLRLYGFWRGEGRFAELLRILEKDGATGLGGSQRALRFVGIGLA
jgi:hypothetical protein